MCLIALYVSPLVNCLFKTPAHFLISLFVFFLLNFEYSLYILGTLTIFYIVKLKQRERKKRGVKQSDMVSCYSIAIHLLSTPPEIQTLNLGHITTTMSHQQKS